jgi:3-methyl-2-oxobutanoate hydroxymethyltransferase
MTKSKPDKRMTVPEFRARKAAAGAPLVVVTAYEAMSAKLADAAGVDAVLVGDSLGPVVMGYENTVPVTFDEILHHVRAVRNGLKNALLIADLPFGTYQESVAQATHHAVRLLKEGGAQAVKIEGGAPHILEIVERFVQSAIPVMGHIGLTPQSYHAFGGHRVQGRDEENAERLMREACALETAGVFGLVLETIPAELAAKVTASISIPTIGIGAGAHCDGQVQVWHDILGLAPRVYKHTKRYANLTEIIGAALYTDEVRRSEFPSEEQSLH